ncbi:hypothetical protein JNM05_15915, partial [bacterium]|nr:hypothetical protein [bacterium]
FKSFKDIFVSIELVVEAMNNPEPAVFFENTGTNYDDFLGRLRFTTTPFFNENDDHYLFDINIDELYHGRDIETTQYCSFSKKKETKAWMASHHEELHNTFKKLLYYCDYSVHQNITNMRNIPDDVIRLIISQPIVILQGELLKAKAHDNTVELVPTEHVQYTFSYSSVNKGPSYINVDVITESGFDSYLERLKNELVSIGHNIEALPRFINRVERKNLY